MCQCVTAAVRRQHDIDYGSSKRFYVADNARTALIEYEYDGLACSGERLDHIALIFRETQVCQIAWCLTVCVLTYAGNDDIGCSGRSCQCAEVWVVKNLLVVFAVIVILQCCVEHHVLAAILCTEGFENGVRLYERTALRSLALRCCSDYIADYLVDVLTLPCVGPSAVERTQAVGIRSCHKYLLAVGKW